MGISYQNTWSSRSFNAVRQMLGLETAMVFHGFVHPLAANRPFAAFIKRAFDIFGSIALIIAFSPVMIAAAIAIILDSRGSVFFSTLDDGSPVQRVGRRGKPFRYFKFRTMRPKTDSMRDTTLAPLNMRANSPLVKFKDDPRVTRVGKFLRRYSIDELPEFFLVLKGDMSLVGPRPHLPEEVERYQPWHCDVLDMKPGITGVAQINGRADLAFDDEARLDIEYIRGWSFLTDIRILLKTPHVVFSRKGAY